MACLFQETSPLLGNQEYDLLLTWEKVTLKVKERKTRPGSLPGIFKSVFVCSNEHTTILNEGINSHALELLYEQPTALCITE